MPAAGPAPSPFVGHLFLPALRRTGGAPTLIMPTAIRSRLTMVRRLADDRERGQSVDVERSSAANREG